jgi:hypothetical protein
MQLKLPNPEEVCSTFPEQNSRLPRLDFTNSPGFRAIHHSENSIPLTVISVT